MHKYLLLSTNMSITYKLILEFIVFLNTLSMVIFYFLIIFLLVH